MSKKYVYALSWVEAMEGKSWDSNRILDVAISDKPIRMRDYKTGTRADWAAFAKLFTGKEDGWGKTPWMMGGLELLTEERIKELRKRYTRIYEAASKVLKKLEPA